MAWIKEIEYKESTGKLRKIYDRIQGPDGYIDNILKVHSLRPYSLEGHMALYKYVLHNSTNVTPVQFLEALGVYVSMLNKCSYCVDHHYQGMKRLVNNDLKSEGIYSALENDEPEKAFSSHESTIFNYAKKLTLSPADLVEQDVESLRNAGLSDGEILEINQVVSYFCYANRTVLGLGVNTKGDILGLSPNDQTDDGNWSHT